MSLSRPLDPRSALMVLSSIVEPGDADLDDLITDVGPIEAVERIWSGDVTDRLRRITAAPIASGPDPAARAADIDAATAACGARVLIPDDPQWPRQLADLGRISDSDEPHLRPPRCLWVRGRHDLAAMTERSVGLIGSRAATEYGNHLADDLAADLAQAGWTVASGSSLGIERAAKLGAFARGGPAVAVLASGLAGPYPSANRALLDLVADSGAVVSEWPPAASAIRVRFSIRQRLLAALTAGTVVIEAGHRSGARTTARIAAELGRVLMFTPGPVTSSMSAGVHRLAREPWGAKLVASAEDIIDDLTADSSAAPAPEGSPRPEFDALTGAQQHLIETLPVGYLVETDRLAAAAGLTSDATASHLEALRNAGWVDRVDGRWRLAQTPAA